MWRFVIHSDINEFIGEVSQNQNFPESIMEFNYNRYLPPFLSYIDAYDSGDTLYADVTRLVGTHLWANLVLQHGK